MFIASPRRLFHLFNDARWRHRHCGAEFGVLGSSYLFLEEAQLVDQLLVEYDLALRLRLGRLSTERGVRADGEEQLRQEDCAHNPSCDEEEPLGETCAHFEPPFGARLRHPSQVPS